MRISAFNVRISSVFWRSLPQKFVQLLMMLALAKVDALLHVIEDKKSLSKDIFYDALYVQIEEYVKSKKCQDLIAVTANCAALIFNELRDAFGECATNWTGFYFVRNDQLILGPFQGKTACTVINFNEGVCGYSATNMRTALVPDVHKFEGHIACDSDSKSEIVVPIIDKDKKLVAVLDIDCPKLNGFDEYDQERLEQICKLIGQNAHWETL